MSSACSQTGDMLERCLATCGKAAGVRAKSSRKEASAQKSTRILQAVQAKHVEWKYWIDNEVFVFVDVRKVKSKNSRAQARVAVVDEYEYGAFAWDLPSLKDVFEVLGYRFHRDGKESQGADRTMCKGTAIWWRDRYIYWPKNVPKQTKCRRIPSHVCSTDFNGSVNWLWSVTMLAEARLGGSNSASHPPSQDVCGIELGWLHAEDSPFFVHQVEQDVSADDDHKKWTKFGRL